MVDSNTPVGRRQNQLHLQEKQLEKTKGTSIVTELKMLSYIALLIFLMSSSPEVVAILSSISFASSFLSVSAPVISSTWAAATKASALLALLPSPVITTYMTSPSSPPPSSITKFFAAAVSVVSPSLCPVMPSTSAVIPVSSSCSKLFSHSSCSQAMCSMLSRAR